jgi:drug/metabolite transporter (DMT)-like permease
MLLAGLAMLAVGLARGEWRVLSFSGRTVGALVYLIGVGSLVGYTAYTYALKHLPMATVSLYAYVNPVIAVALGTLVLDEPLSPRIVVASAVVLTGIALVRKA